VHVSRDDLPKEGRATVLHPKVFRRKISLRLVSRSILKNDSKEGELGRRDMESSIKERKDKMTLVKAEEKATNSHFGIRSIGQSK